jgi:hypothetical protein
LENNRIVYEEQRNIHTGGSELVIGGIAGADSLKSFDGSASAISMAFFEDIGAADHTSGSEVVIGGIAGADSLTSVDGPRSAISMAPFEDVAAADHTSGSELDKLREDSVAEIFSVTFDDTAVAIGIRTGEAILWSRALDAKNFFRRARCIHSNNDTGRKLFIIRTFVCVFKKTVVCHAGGC